MNSMLMAILSSVLISLLSVLIALLFRWHKGGSKIQLLVLVGVATGALLGDAFLHLIPESSEFFEGSEIGLWVIGGMMIFFGLEKLLQWRHCHDPDCHQGHKLAEVSMVADTVHNFIDGLIIGGSFLAGRELGISTAIAILIHEIPQEIGDFAILLHSGYDFKKALKMNLWSSLASLVGVVLIMVFKESLSLKNYLMPLTAGGFIYLAASDLIPELHRHEAKLKESLGQLVAVLFGVAVMYFLL